MKKLSVIIPAYNIEKYIDTCVQSFVDCEEVLQDIEIIVVNDGSTDTTKDKAQAYEIRYPDIVKVVNKENGGHGSAINAGIESAKGIYVKVVDGDDWVLREGLIELIKCITEFSCKESMPEMIINPYDIIYEDANKVEKITFAEYDVEKIYGIADLVQKKRNVEMHGITFKTEIFKKNAIHIDERMFYVDTEYILFPVPYINELVFLKQSLYQYRMGNVGQSVSLINMQKRRNIHKMVIMSLLSYYEKYKDIFDENQKQYYLFRTAMMTTAQANIYCTMEDTEMAKKEIKIFFAEYDGYKKEHGIDRKVDKTINKKVPFLKMTNYIFFNQVSQYYRKKHKI